MIPSVKRILCHANRSSQASSQAADILVAALRRAGYEVIEGLDSFFSSAPDLLLFLGGDGFLMESMRSLEYPSTQVFGINFGTVGFLMNTKECLPDFISMLKEWNLREEEHAVLEGKVTLEDGSEEVLLAFNDFVVERMSRQAVRLDVYLDEVPFNRYAGDGFVLSTAAGSTAYNLAAGGPVVHPGLQVILVTPLYPHRASPFHSLQFSVIAPLKSRLRIVADDLPKRSMRVVGDGKQMEHVASIEVRDSGRRVRLLRPHTHVFVRTLARKFIGQT